MGLPERKRVVQRYFEEVLDGGQAAVLRELCTDDVVQRFPGITVQGLDKVIAGLGRIPATYSSFKTTMHAIIGEGDLVSAHISHNVVVREALRTRIGVLPAVEKPLEWNAIALFRFEGDRIAEEWIARDDLGLLLQLGAVKAGGDR